MVSCTPEEASRPDAPAAEAAQSVTVDQDTVNRLIHLLDEIATAEGAVESFVTQRGLDTGALGRLMSSLRRSVADAGVLAAEIGTHELGGVFVQMQRAVRGMARELGKEIRLKTVGADVRADQSVLEILTDSLIHIVRNAADHGIELPQTREAAGKPRAGLITLSAAKKNDLLTVTVEDDGAGIDRSAVLAQAERRGKLTKPKERYTDAEVYELLLTSGVSTSRSVTQYSGRGVGLDTVMRRIRQAGGSVTVASEAGRGTVFTLRIPLTLMVIDGIEITAESGGHVVVPANDIRHILALGPASEGIVYRGEEYAVLPFPGEKWERRSQGGYALLLAEEYGRRCLLARTVSMMTTYYGKPMPEYVVSAMGKGYLYSGCVTGADARLCCVLDAGRLIRESSERQSEL